MKTVSIYTTPTCTYCKMAKSFMQEKGIAYEEFDVQADLEKRKEMVDLSGQMGVPVIKIGDEVMVGFDQQAFATALGV